MSYRSRFNVVECKASMQAKHVNQSRRRMEAANIYAESCFLDEMRRTAEALLDEGLSTAMVEVPKNRCWFAGNHVNEEFFALLAPMIVGRLSGYFVGEDGSLYGGFLIEDGALSRRTVRVTLENP